MQIVTLATSSPRSLCCRVYIVFRLAAYALPGCSMLMLHTPLQARRMDHFERAKREEEAPLILAAHTHRLEVRLL